MFVRTRVYVWVCVCVGVHSDAKLCLCLLPVALPGAGETEWDRGGQAVPQQKATGAALMTAAVVSEGHSAGGCGQARQGCPRDDIFCNCS